MGWAAKNNPVAQAARRGEIPPKKPPLGKKAVRQIISGKAELIRFPDRYPNAKKIKYGR